MAMRALALCTVANKAQTMPQMHCVYVSIWTGLKGHGWTYGHSGNVPSWAELLQDNVGRGLEEHITDEEDGQGEVVLVVGEFEVGGQAKDFGISDVSPACGVSEILHCGV